MDILRGPVRSRQDADLGMCRVDGVYIVTVCIRAHYMLVWGCSRVASGPFCACAAATATAVLFWWSVWLWSCCGVLGGRPLRWLVFRNTHVRWFVAEVTASTTPTHRAAVPERRNTDRTKDKKISYLGGIPVRLVLVGRPRRPTDRRRSSDEHTNKREVELTSISQQTTTEGTPLGSCWC